MKVFHYLLLAGLIASCSKKGIISMSVLEPSAVHVPLLTKKLGLLNRTLPSKETKPLDDIEKLLSLESPNLDKEGADAATIALKDRLAKGDRYTELKSIDDQDLKTVGAGIFPQLLNWEQVARLCQTYQLDAILSLEFTIQIQS